MGTTYDAIFAGNASLQTTVVIEGFPYILTDGDPSLASLAYVESDNAALSDFGDFTAVGGLSVYWDLEQRVSPWKPFTEPMMVKFSVVPATTYDGPAGSAGSISDVIGQTVFKRAGGTSTHITAALDCDDTTITCQRVDDFAASGTLYAGPERITYSSRDTGADTFTVSARGTCSVFETEAGDRFARTHKPTTYTSPSQNVGLNPVVGTEPRTWVGRWVGIWLHKKNGTASIDTPNHDQSDAHLAFAGRIVSVEDADGATWFTAEDVRRKIYETTIMRDPFRARVQEGVRLNTGMTFACHTERLTTSGGASADADALTVVSGTPADSNEVQAGVYTAEELGAVLNEWLQGEKNAGRILFDVRYDALGQAADGSIRGHLSYSDPTATAMSRQVKITSSAYAYIRFLGWTSGIIDVVEPGRQGEAFSDAPPLRAWIWNQGNGQLGTMGLDQPRGTWVSQTTLLPQGLREPGDLIDGVLRIGSLGYVRAGRVSDTSFRFSPYGLDAFFANNAASFSGNVGNAVAVTMEDDVSLEVEQVLLLSATFKSLLLRILFSTGTANFNTTDYDNLSETIGAAIPYSICGDDFVTEVENLDCADMELTAIVRKPTTFGQLFEADFLLRRIFFVWGNGRLRMGAWSSPNSGYASFTLDETTKASPTGTQDNQRAQVSEDDDFYNVVKIAYSPDAEGNLQDEITLVDAASIRDHGERSITINARNTFRGAGSVGVPLDELVSIFAGYFPYTSKPWQVIRRTIDHTRIESTYPGAILALTDKYVRDPDTGLRYSNTTSTGGVSGYPGMVLRQSFDWGGAESGRDGAPPHVRAPGGEVDIMISPQRSQATYVPCAQVNEGAANAGYDSGTKTLTLHAHKFTESGESNDNTFFSAGDEVLVHEIDPDDPTSFDSWSDVVASVGTNTLTLTTGLSGFDTTGATLYRVIYDAYGTVGSTQKTKCYQADDADGMVVDTVQAYGFGFFAQSQGSVNPTTVAPTTAPCRYANIAYGDGRPLDVGFDSDIMKLAQNLLHYKTAPQQPTSYSETRNYAGSGTWRLVEMQPVFVGMQQLGALARSLTVAVQMRSTDGSDASVRVRLCRLRPTGSSPDDVSFLAPYQTVTFTDDSTSFLVPTAQTLDISHLKLSDASNGGWGWVTVEVSSNAEFRGFAKFYLGAAS